MQRVNISGPSEFQCGRFRLALTRPLVMGILNITPDSFYDGAHFLTHDAALKRAMQMVDEGVDLIDIGGESTRPGAPAVPLNEELERVLPIIKALRDVGVPLSIDTHKPDVMRAALAEGADLINDILGLRQPGALELVKQSGCGLCVMHMSGTPQTMQRAPSYQDVVAEVAAFLHARIAELEAAGIARSRMSVDPGFGFGKTLEHNYSLLAHLAQLAPADVPLLIGLSRKSMLGAVIDRPASERAAASIAGAICAAERGARIIRVHDVAPTVDALKIWSAVRTADSAK